MPGYVQAPQQDEWSDIVKKIYLCCAEGCGEVIGSIARKYCNDHLTKEGRDKMKEENEKVQKHLLQLRETKQWLYAS